MSTDAISEASARETSESDTDPLSGTPGNGIPLANRHRKTKSPSPGTRTVARYRSKCASCSTLISPGDMIGRLPPTAGRYGERGWICIPCQTSAREVGAPTLRDVVARIYIRWAKGKPVGLNNLEVELLVNELLQIDAELTPKGRCSPDDIDPNLTQPYAPWQRWDQSAASIDDILGYMLDAVHFEFSCNLSTHSALRLLVHMLVKTCTCGKHLPHDLVCVYEMMRIVTDWEDLDWQHPLRVKGLAAFAERYNRTTLPSLL